MYYIIDSPMKASEILHMYEKAILVALTSMMALVVLLATVDLGWRLGTYILSPPLFMVEVRQLVDIFGLFLLVLIGMELLETIRTYRQERRLRVEIAIIVALLAISRKIIILNYKHLTSFTLLHIGAIVLALAGAYYLLHLTRTHIKESSRPEDNSESAG